MEISGTPVVIQFNWACKCFNEDPNKFLLDNVQNGCEILCTVCERKYKVNLQFQEVE